MFSFDDDNASRTGALRVAAAGSIAYGVGILVAAVMTGVAIEFRVNEPGPFLDAIAKHRSLYLASNALLVVVQVLVAPLLVGVVQLVGRRHPLATILGVAYLGASAVFMVASAAVNLVVGADIALDYRDAPGDMRTIVADRGGALHDVADGLFFVAFALIALALMLFARALTALEPPSRALVALATVAAAGHLLGLAAFAIEALFVVGVVGIAALAAWAIAVGIRLAQAGMRRQS